MATEPSLLDRLTELRDRLHGMIHEVDCEHYSSEDDRLHVHYAADARSMPQLARAYADVLARIEEIKGTAQSRGTGGVEGLVGSAKGKLRAVPGTGRR